MERGPVVRIVEALGWAWTAGVGALLATQAVGWSGAATIAVAQALTPPILVATALVTTVAATARRPALAIGSGAALAGLALLAAPLVFHGGHEPAADGTTGLSVTPINLLFDNPSATELADDLMRRDPDVVGFSEYTPAHHRTLDAHPLRDRYPHRIDLYESFGSGMALWSKYPFVERGPAILADRGIDATVAGPDGPIRILFVHPRTPISDNHAWRAALDDIGERVTTAGAPTAVVGDFNAAYWHPPFRKLLDAGLTDAHIAAGRGWSVSWPLERDLPAFVRLDHALTDDRLTVTELLDFDPPGSDHRGFVVTVAPVEVSSAG